MEVVLLLLPKKGTSGGGSTNPWCPRTCFMPGSALCRLYIFSVNVFPVTALHVNTSYPDLSLSRALFALRVRTPLCWALCSPLPLCACVPPPPSRRGWGTYPPPFALACSRNPQPSYLKIRNKPHPWTCADCSLLDSACFAKCKEERA